MDFKDYVKRTDEKPLDSIVSNGGFCGIFRTIACIGDSLSSGEFESLENGEKAWHDCYEYSWGQFMARDIGSTVYNFSKGGMTAREYDSFARERNFWSIEYQSQAYIIAMGVNDVSKIIDKELEFGEISDIDPDNYAKNKPTFIGYYAKIIAKYKLIQPRAKFFLVTMPVSHADSKERAELYDKHREVLYKLCEIFDNCYVIDLRKYAPAYDGEFKDNFRLGGHLAPTGYRLTALMIESYIDYIIRNAPEDFKQVGFIGKTYSYSE